VTPHVAQNIHARKFTSAIDGRTTREAQTHRRACGTPNPTHHRNLNPNFARRLTVSLETALFHHPANECWTRQSPPRIPRNISEVRIARGFVAHDPQLRHSSCRAAAGLCATGAVPTICPLRRHGSGRQARLGSHAVKSLRCRRHPVGLFCGNGEPIPFRRARSAPHSHLAPRERLDEADADDPRTRHSHAASTQLRAHPTRHTHAAPHDRHRAQLRAPLSLRPLPSVAPHTSSTPASNRSPPATPALT
jgi:hypothetical protein